MAIQKLKNYLNTLLTNKKHNVVLKTKVIENNLESHYNNPSRLYIVYNWQCYYTGHLGTFERDTKLIENKTIQQLETDGFMIDYSEDGTTIIATINWKMFLEKCLNYKFHQELQNIYNQLNYIIKFNPTTKKFYLGIAINSYYCYKWTISPIKTEKELQQLGFYKIENEKMSNYYTINYYKPVIEIDFKMDIDKN